MSIQEKNDIVLELKNISKHFGGIKAVDGVNMTVRRNELRGLIGPNGAGKSTIFKLIMGVYAPTGGEILFEGQPLNGLASWQRSRKGISIKMQIPGVYSELTLRENMRIAAQNYVKESEIESEIDRIIDFLGISDLGNPIVKNMPHGQQQWLEIGMALVSKPTLLLLDEPAAGMGPEETEFTARLVQQINKSGITVIFIDHDMEFVKRIAQNITVLHYGKIFAEGTQDEIVNHEGVKEIYLGKV